MSISDLDGQQPALLRFVEALDGALDRLGDPDPLYLSPAQKKAALLGLAREEERLAALRSRVQGAADDVAEVAGARHAGAVLACDARRSPAVAGRDQALADALHERWADTGAVWRAGLVNRDQVAVIVEALDRLPGDLDPAMLRKAQDYLLDQAQVYGPRELRLLGKRIWEVIDPAGAEEQEREALEREEANARASTRFNLRRMGDGSTRLSGRVPDAVAQRLATLLAAYTSPRRDHLTGDVRDPATGERLAADRLRGQAFCTLVEHADPDRLPRHGQTATSVVVTMDLTQLLAGTGAGTLADGTRLSAGEVRRLACTAALVPAVLGGPSEVLDLGRESRLFNTPQRKAMGIRDRHCRAEGCTVPATWCEAHHLTPWPLGGRTDLRDGALLCSFHHHRIHDPGRRHTRLPDGSFRFHRRT
jgi:hypothetical protein